MTTIALPLNTNANNNFKALLNTEMIAGNKFSEFFIHDDLGKAVIALDPHKNKLLFLPKDSHAFSCLVIDLNSLKQCSVKKEYNTIDAGALTKTKLNKFLKSIFLNLRGNNGQLALSIYNDQDDEQADVELFEKKAKKWLNILSRFLPIQIRKKAPESKM